jgi:UDP-3-O-acyl-N-acetylglucosamine deacetylase
LGFAAGTGVSLPTLRLKGAGVHTGAAGEAAFSLREDGKGPRFLLPWSRDPIRPAELASLPRRANRSTVIGEGESRLGTPEHMLAALLFFADLPLDVRCEGPEVPGLDGSALPFRDLLKRFSPRHASAPAWREYPCDLAWETEWDGGFLRAAPAGNFAVTYEIDRASLRQSFRLESPRQAWEEILPARTFAFHREWREAVADPKGPGPLGRGPTGLMAGAGVDSGLLLAESESEFAECLAGHPEWAHGPYPLLNQKAWRVDDEPVKHKILDLLGDLALLGLALPRLDLHVRNGGHRQNHLLLEKLATACRFTPGPGSRRSA